VDAKSISFFLISMIALLCSFSYSFFFPMDTFFGGIPLTLSIMSFFFMGATLFGVLAFLPHIFFGLSMGAQRNAAIFIYLVPIVLATYAGTKLGSALWDDFNAKKYFLGEGKRVLLFLFLAIVLSLIIEVALPMVINLWPQDYFGMNLKEGVNIIQIIQGFSLTPQ